MKKFTFCFLFCCISIISSGQCPTSITLSSQAEVDNFITNYPNCTEITGALFIGTPSLNQSTDINDLSSLPPIESVGVFVRIGRNPNLTSLEGLNNLTSVNGYVEIYNNSSLVSLSGLDNLNVIDGRVDIYQNNSLTTLEGLSNLGTIGGYLSIRDNDNLSSIALSDLDFVEGLLSIFRNDSLSSLGDMNNLVSIGGDFRIDNNQSLDNLQGLGSLNTINGDLNISDNAILSSLDGVENLNSIGGLIIENNDALTNISGLQGLNSIGDVDIVRNDILSSLSGLENVIYDSNDEITITNNPNIYMCDLQNICNHLVNHASNFSLGGNGIGCNSTTQIELSCEAGIMCPVGDVFFLRQDDVDYYGTIFPNCTEIEGNLCIGGEGMNSSINNLSSFSAITSIVGDMKIINTTNLLSLNGLENLNSVGGSLIIEDNTYLVDLTHLSNLTNIGSPLSIIDNYSLTTLSGLEGIDLSNITHINIYDNYNLSFCNLPNICDYLSDDNQSSSIYNNSEYCAYRSVVLAACNSSCPPADLVLITQQDVDDFVATYPECTDFAYNLDIGLDYWQGDITDLSGLNQIHSVAGSLVIQNNPTLVSLEGLHNIDSIGGSLTLRDNNLLADVIGLNSLTYVNSIYIESNYVLLDFIGFNNIKNVHNLNIFNNLDIVSFNGLDSLNSINGYLHIESNYDLDNFTGLDNLEHIGNYFLVKNNINLKNFNSLQGVLTIGSNLTIENNDSLTNLIGLDSLHLINGDIEITGNYSLTTLNSLSNLDSIRGDIIIRGNSNIENLNGLQNIDPNDIYSLEIKYNPSLSGCNIQNVCDYISGVNPNVDIQNNDAGCDSIIEVDATCNNLICPVDSNLVFNSQQDIYDFATLYPNCTHIKGYVDLYPSGDSDISDLSPLSQINTIDGYLDIRLNDILTSLNGLQNINYIGGNVLINVNDMLSNLSGLEGLDSIGGYLYIQLNDALETLTGLENLTSVGGTVSIINNDVLQHTDALDNLNIIGDNLLISQNNSLSSINGIKNVDHNVLMGLRIDDNPNLSICNVESVCDYLASGKSALIEDNSNGCNSELEVASECGILDCPIGDVTFTSQEDIDNFIVNYPDCTQINSDLNIGYPTSSNILDLTPLNQIEVIGGDLVISDNNNLSNLTGLMNIDSIAGHLYINNNDSLTTISSLDSLTYIGLCIEITNNPMLSSISGFNGILNVFSYINIANNGLDTLNGFANLESVSGNINIQSNVELIEINAFSSVVTIYGHLYLNDNSNLNSVGFSSLSSINGCLEVGNNDALENFEGFSNLSIIGTDGDNDSYFSVTGNASLADFTGLENLDNIFGAIIIKDNEILGGLGGLTNPDLGIGSVTSIDIQNCPNLQICQVPCVCDVLMNGGEEAVIIENNAPGCDSIPEVQMECLALPITLQYLKATNYNQQTLLTWSTATETNNSHFIIEHSIDAQHFTEVGRVAGSGTSLTPQTYSFIHERPHLGVNYYRLRQVDFDSTFEYSDIVNVEFERRGFHIFPNPVESALHLQFDTSQMEIEVNITSTTGKVIHSEVVDFSDGATLTTFDIENYPVGVYFLSVNDGKEIQVQRFIKS